MPTEMLMRNGRTESPQASASMDDELRAFARRHLELVRRLKFHLAAFLLGMVVLTPIWLLVEWQDNGSFERWSNNGNPGDWEPWILYVALAWGLYVAIAGLKVYFDRPTTEAAIEREVRRIESRN